MSTTVSSRPGINYPVLVLNQSYEPLNICRARRALVLIFDGKAELVEDGTGFIHTTRSIVPLPSVIRLAYMVKRPRMDPKLTRFEVFNRDQFTCQYCGKQTRQLTLDHVVPRHLGGEHSWENLISACVICNHKKAGRTPEQARMKLLRKPAKPRSKTLFTVPYHYRQTFSQWQKYLPNS